MPRDPLDSVLRLRRQAVDESRQALTQMLAHATAADGAAHAAERAIADEMALASRLDAADSVVEAFAAWLPTGRHRLNEARRRQAHTTAEVARLRAELTACRTALETIEQLRDERRARTADHRARQRQRDLDDAGRNRPNPDD